MIVLRFDFEGEGQLVWATHPQEILDHMKNYVSHEASLVPAKQVTAPSFDTMRDLRDELQSLITTANKQEGIRSDARDAYDTTLKQLKQECKRIIVLLKGKHFGHWQRLERWGLQVVETKKGTKVRSPHNEVDWKQFVARYLAEEERLPIRDRLTDPSLADMKDIWNQVRHHERIWRAALAERQIAVEKRNIIEKVCLMHLKWALSSIVVGQYKGVLKQAVERWGYRLVLPAKAT